MKYTTKFILITILFIFILIVFSGCGAIMTAILSTVFGTKAGLVLIPLSIKGDPLNTNVPGMIIVDPNNPLDSELKNYTPLSDVNISIQGSNSIGITDKYGYFSIDNLPEGILNINAVKNNYISFSSDIAVGSTNSTDNIEQFYIIPGALHLISGRAYQLKSYGKTRDNHITEPDRVSWEIAFIYESTEDSSMKIIPNDGIASINSNGLLIASNPTRYPIWVYVVAKVNNFTSTSEIIVTPTKGSLSGKVIYENGTPVSGAKVQVVLTPYSTITGADGSYSFPEMPGDFIINVTAQFDTLVGSTIIKVPPDGNSTADIILKTSSSKFIYDSTIGTTGISGNTNSLLNIPEGIAFDNKGNVYVSDRWNNRIQKFDSNNNYITTIGSSNAGNDNKSFNMPGGITLANDKLYICDNNNYRVQVLDTDGNYLATIGTTGQQGKDNNHFMMPADVAIDSEGNIYVSDNGNFRVQKFDSSGNYILTIGETGVSGTDNYHFGIYYAPCAVGIDKNNNLYVSDSYPNERVQIYNSSGQYIDTMGELGVHGVDNNHFHFPADIGFDSKNNIFITDYYNHRIQVFDANHVYLDTIGITGLAETSNNTFKQPKAVGVNPLNNKIYVVDSLNHRVQIFKPEFLLQGN